MPLRKTIPVPDLLVREITDPDAANALVLYSDALDELVSFGTHILMWECSQVSEEMYRLSIIAYFRQVLELIDGISTLLKSGAAPPCVILLRSLFETSLGLEYMLKEDTERRGQCYYYYGHANQLKIDLRHDPSNQNYAAYQEQYKHSQSVKKVPIIANLKERIRRASEVLDYHEHVDIKAEYKRLKSKNRSFEWYTLFSDKTNGGTLIHKIQDLAIHLNRFDWYDVLYKEYSKATHGSSLTMMNLYRSANDNSVSVLGLRHLFQAHDVANLTVNLAEVTFNLMRERNPNREQAGDIMWWKNAFDTNYKYPVLNTKINVGEAGQ